MTDLRRALKNLSEKSATVLQWIPAHCGITGNENADRLAKEGGKQAQHLPSQSYQEPKTLIKTRWKSAFSKRTGGYHPTKDPIHHLGRAEQTAIFRPRTEHCGLNAHLKRIGVAESALCGYGTEEQTPQHMLQTCSPPRPTASPDLAGVHHAAGKTVGQH